MIKFEQFEKLEGQAIHETLADAWKAPAIDRRPTWRGAYVVPIDQGYAPVGAAIFFAVLAYPNDPAKQEAYVRAVAAWSIKSLAPPRSHARRKAREDRSTAWALDIPNKRIQQLFNDCARQIARRNRAAWVLLQKMVSDPDPARQSPLNQYVLTAARQNTRSYPAFFSTQTDPVDQEEAVSDSFRRQILAAAKPVAHLAMAFYLRFETGNPSEIDLFKLVERADNWFKPTLITAEILRVSFGDLFPRYDTKSTGAERAQNYSAPMTETIAVLPYVGPIEPPMDFLWFLHNSRELSKTMRP